MSSFPASTTRSAQAARAFVASVALLNVLVAAPLRASQQAIDINGTVACQSCRLEVRRIALLGTVEGEGALAGEPTAVVQDSRGNFLVTQFQERTQILVFDRASKFVQRIGRVGSGPGEYRRIAFLAMGAGDSLYVFDEGNARLTVLTPGYALARSAAISGQYFGGVQLGDGRFAANAHLREPNHPGQPLQTLGLNGALHAVYGAKNPAYRPDVPYSVMRTIARAGSGSVWSAYKTQYVIEEWRNDGTQLRVVTRAVPWFKSYEKRRPITQAQPAEPWMMALNQDRSGLLWTAMTVPTEDWVRLWKELGIDEKKGVGDPRLSNTIVEILDLDRGHAVLSQRLPQHILGFLNDSTVYAYSTDADDVPHIEILRLRFIQGASRQ